MKKKQAMDANMAWVVVDLLHSRERERVPVSDRQPLFVTSIGVETEPRTLSTNQRGMEIVSVPTQPPSTLITFAESQRPASEPGDLEKRT